MFYILRSQMAKTHVYRIEWMNGGHWNWCEWWVESMECWEADEKNMADARDKMVTKLCWEAFVNHNSCFIDILYELFY